jgi:hypothetical protein
VEEKKQIINDGGTPTTDFPASHTPAARNAPPRDRPLLRLGHRLTRPDHATRSEGHRGACTGRAQRGPRGGPGLVDTLVGLTFVLGQSSEGSESSVKRNEPKVPPPDG